MSGNFDTFRVDYQYVAKSQAAAKLTGQGGKGMIGDIIENILVIPLTASPGQVTLQDGNGAAMVIFQGGANAGINPVPLHFSCKSVLGAFTVVTGDNVALFVQGRFQ